MKVFKVSTLCALFLFSSIIANLSAQTTDGDEIYYSNPKKGINAKPPAIYTDSTVMNKSDDITVELVGENIDSTVHDSAAAFSNGDYYDYAYTARINRFHRGMGFDYYDAHYTDMYWYTGNPLYWGTSIYYAWDPWYSPWWNTWYYPGWGGSYWHTTYSWGWGPYWSFGYGPGWAYGWGWGNPWYYDPFYYPGWYGWYGWGGAYAWNTFNHGGAWGGHNGYAGHRYLGNSRSSTNPTYRNTTGGGTPAPTQRGTVRRGGVDRSSSATRYAKPQRVTEQRNRQTGMTRSNASANSGRGASYSTSQNGRFSDGTRSSRSTSYSNGRQPSRSTNFENGSRQTTRSTSFDSRSSSSRSSFGTSSGRSSSSSGHSGSFGGGHSSGGHSSSSSSSRR